MHIALYLPPDAGHVNSTLGLVAELAARGHRVSCAVTEEFAPAMRAAGGLPVTYSSTMELAQRAESPAGDPFGGSDLAALLRLLLTEAIHVLPILLRAFGAEPPDVVVYDAPIGWAGRLLAERLGVRSVASVTTFAANEHWSLADEHTGTDFTEAGRLIAAVGAFLSRIRSGLTADELVFGRSTDQTLVYLPREFHPAAETFEERFHFVGPCLPEAETQKSDPPLALVSLGTVYTHRPDFYRACADAFAEPGWRVVISVGKTLSPHALGPVPDRIEVRPSVPQLDVLRQADVFVCHAGMRSLMESLSFGVPVVAVPQMSEQRANADRIAELGLGIRLDSMSNLRSAVETVHADEDIRHQVDLMRKAIRASGGATAAADVVERGGV